MMEDGQLMEMLGLIERLEHTPDGLTLKLKAWQPETNPADGNTYSMTFTVDEGGFGMEPDDLLGDCMEIMSATPLDELLSPRLRQMWLTGRLADEVAGFVASSGIAQPWVVSGHDEDEEE